jgi:carbonic anhydrase
VKRVAQTPIVQDAWSRGQDLLVHGLVYGLKDGRLRNLGCTLDGPRAADAIKI